MRDLIFVSLENWDDIWRRNQFLCAGLARRFPDQKILFVGRQRFIPREIALKRAARLRETLEPVPDYPNIFTTYLPKLLPNPAPGGQKINDKMMRAHVQRQARRLKLADPLLWLNPHYGGHFIGHLGERGVVYDITDDWELAADSEKQRLQIQKNDRELCRRVDLTITCSEALYESRRAISRRCLLLPNGVDAAHYRKSAEVPTQRLWKAPVFGYTGTLHPARIDLSIIRDLARAHPEGTVALVGPVAWLDDELKKLLAAQSNVVVTGALPYAQLPELMAQFDVCIVPHQQSAFTESLNPIKLWEYLACGKPIVSTDIAGFRSYPQFCRIAANSHDFILACREALQEARSGDLSLLQQRRTEAEGHSWEARIDTLLENLESAELLP